jgi:general nucleoside transport system ATP-binding protein
VSERAEPVLRLSGITKRFGSLLANDAISLTLRRGEVLALLGENGAGKSTLVSILFGHYVADAGSIEAFGKPLPPGDPAAALAAGIGMVHQHFTLADNLSVQDNVMLGTEPLWRPASRRREARRKLLATAARFGLRVNPEARVGSLSVGER